MTKLLPIIAVLILGITSQVNAQQQLRRVSINDLNNELERREIANDYAQCRAHARTESALDRCIEASPEETRVRYVYCSVRTQDQSALDRCMQGPLPTRFNNRREEVGENSRRDSRQSSTCDFESQDTDGRTRRRRQTETEGGTRVVLDGGANVYGAGRRVRFGNGGVRVRVETGTRRRTRTDEIEDRRTRNHCERTNP